MAVFSTAETSAKERLESYLNLIMRSILTCPCRHKIFSSSHGLRTFRGCLLRPISTCFRISHFACKLIVPSPHPNVGISQNASIRIWNNEVAFQIQNPVYVQLGFREDTYPGLLAQQGRVANSLPSHLYRPSVANRRPFAAWLAGNGHPY